MEIGIWICVIAVTIGIRFYILYLEPGYIWTGDSGSYAKAAFRWLDGDGWTTDSRRGPVYAAFIALGIKLGGNMTAVMWMQQALGAVAILATALLARRIYGRKAIVPIGLCAAAFGVYSLPIHVGFLIRNESILFITATAAIIGWAMFLTSRQAAWLVLSGLGAGILTLTKNVYAPFVPVVCVLLVWLLFRQPLALLRYLSCFILAAALPFIGNKVFNAKFAASVQPPCPQDGILFYGRTAQFTKLDGGIAPEIKQLITPKVEEYREMIRRKKGLSNNWVIYRGVIPVIRTRFRELQKTDAELNKFCRQLALEAIREHPGEYMRQVTHDLVLLLTKFGRPQNMPELSDVKSSISTLKSYSEPHWALALDHTLSRLELAQKRMVRPKQNAAAIAAGEHVSYKTTYPYRFYLFLTRCAWLFWLTPVLLTSLLLPCQWWLARQTDLSLFWIASGAVWYFNILLLCTVGRPLHRYLISVTPVMFLVLAASVIWLWNRLLALPPATASNQTPAS